jgi:hypothetical protein
MSRLMLSSLPWARLRSRWCLAAPPDGIDEPDALRRVDGSSVYTIASTDLYTSPRILDDLEVEMVSGSSAPAPQNPRAWPTPTGSRRPPTGCWPPSRRTPPALRSDPRSLRRG